MTTVQVFIDPRRVHQQGRIYEIRNEGVRFAALHFTPKEGEDWKEAETRVFAAIRALLDLSHEELGKLIANGISYSPRVTGHRSNNRVSNIPRQRHG